MNKFKIFFATTSFLVILFSSIAPVGAQSLFGYTDPPGCENKDRFLPNLVICGRSPATGACQAYTKPCNLGDLVETVGRALVWLLSIALLIVPLLVMYYGAMIIWEQKYDGNIATIQVIKKRFKEVILYFILMLAAWLIIRTVVDIFQVEDRVPSFLIDERGNQIKARSFNTD